MNSVTVETSILEQIFEDEAQCESQHDQEGNRYCSGRAKYRVSYVCGPETLLICDAYARTIRRWVRQDCICDDCGRFISECWTVNAI